MSVLLLDNIIQVITSFLILYLLFPVEKFYKSLRTGVVMNQPELNFGYGLIFRFWYHRFYIENVILDLHKEGLLSSDWSNWTYEVNTKDTIQHLKILIGFVGYLSFLLGGAFMYILSQN